jgi:DNA-binding PadR family transcriptional regulator
MPQPPERPGPPPRGHRGHRHGPRARPGPGGARTRWWRGEDDGWEVRARVERFVEPALLLVLRDTESYGYSIAEEVERLAPEERVDLGNLYRLLRALEEEGLVSSSWRSDLPGRSKRTYELTDGGRAALDAWAEALRGTRATIDRFIERHERGATT